MPTTFHDPDPVVTALLAEVMRAYHPRLHEAGVRVRVLMAENPDGDAITHGGYPALATMKPESAINRAKWDGDALLKIDQKGWDELEDAQREALLDHELSHIDTIDLSPDELRQARAEAADAPTWKTDDRGRPKLRSVPGNLNVGDMFLAVIARHGANAIEYRNIRRAERSADLAWEKGIEERRKAAGGDAGEAA